MNTAVAAMPDRTGASGTLLVAGIVLATLTEAIASTVLSLGRADIIGDTYATPDEFAWLDVGYIALKLIGFMAAPWLMGRLDPRSLIIGSTLVMGMACGIAAVTADLELLVVLRAIKASPAAPCWSRARLSFFSAFRHPASRSCRRCLRWGRSSRRRRSRRLSKVG